ncbi:transcriptional regulator domain-containing protein [Brucella rhizosphaerae]|uniref:transcriptional regulator domain-containing protein n=1 Tax=Brucella rhizosphaerae TaxID=571254 RepID=UPI0004652C95|nr:DUF6499 domain-containing protein [Brucella rhizosphaerae]
MVSERVWSSPQFAIQFPPLDRSGFAFEFLRRNSDYRSDFAAFANEGGTVSTREARQVLTTRWGIAFRAGP